MDILKSKIVTGSAGSHSVNTGLNRLQIVKVARQGLQFDERSILDIDDQTGTEWVYLLGFSRRVYFLNAFAEGGEDIFIIYKVTT